MYFCYHSFWQHLYRSWQVHLSSLWYPSCCFGHDCSPSHHAREQLIATIVGLLFLIFSFVILQVIGVDILGIPGASPSGSEAPRSGGEESGVRTNDPGADQSACTAAGGSCSSSQLCAGNGSSLGRLDCSSNQVCCKFQ